MTGWRRSEGVNPQSRMPLPEGVSRGAQFSVVVNDEKVSAFEGESVATVLMANGYPIMRTTQKGEPRGVFCGMGVCFECLVIIDDVPNSRACMTWAAPDMRIIQQQGLTRMRVQEDDSFDD